MGLSADIVGRLVAKGFSGDDLVRLLSDIEREMTPPTSARQAANHRYYVKNKKPKNLNSDTEKDADFGRNKTSPPPQEKNQPPVEGSSELRSESSPAEPVDVSSDRLEIDRTKIEIKARLQGFGEAWNALAAGLKLPQVDFIDPGSKRERSALRTLRDLRAKHDAGPELLLAKIRGSPWLRGEVSDFRATFDWICLPSNFQKIMEDHYAPREKKPSLTVAYARR